MLPTFQRYPSKEPSVATWTLNSSASMPQLLCFSDSHFQFWNGPVPLTLIYRMRNNIPLCHFHFFDVLAFCSHFLKASGIPRLTSFWVEPVLFLFLPPCNRLDISLPSDQCRRVPSAPNLLSFHSNHPSFSSVAKSERAPAKHLLQFFILVLCCPLHPVDCPGLL